MERSNFILCLKKLIVKGPLSRLTIVPKKEIFDKGIDIEEDDEEIIQVQRPKKNKNKVDVIIDKTWEPASPVEEVNSIEDYDIIIINYFYYDLFYNIYL